MKSLRRTLWLWPPLLAGALLRFHNLPDQILGGDEVHGLRAALTMPLGEILFTYLPTDYCQPLTAVNRILLDLGVRLTEMHLRAPALLAGMAAIFVLPSLARRWIGRQAAIVLAWLVACSPILVLYSRVARSYAPVVLVAGLAVLSFFAWLDRPSARRAVGYALAAPLAVYLHLVSVPIVALPFLYAALEKLLGRRSAPSWRALLALGGAASAGVAAFVLPSWPSLRAVIEEKGGGDGFDLAGILPVLELQSGTARPSLTALFWLAAAVGLVRLLRRRPRFGLYTALLAAGQVGAVAMVAPYGVSVPVILNRYLLVLTPIVLLWVAVAVTGMAHSVVRRALRPWRRLLRPSFAAAFVLALLIGGPLADPSYRRTSWLHHYDFMAFHEPLPRLEQAEIPPIFKMLATGQPGALLHFPYRSLWWSARTPYLYQQVHRRRVRVATLERPFWDPRLALRNYVPPTRAGFLGSDARYLVLHLDRQAEEAKIGEVGEGLVPSLAWEHDRDAAGRMLGELTRTWGRPNLRDAGLAVWDLERVRTERAAR